MRDRTNPIMKRAHRLLKMSLPVLVALPLVSGSVSGQEIRPEEQAPPKLAQDLGQALSKITDQRWIVSVSSAPGQPTLAEKAQAVLEAERAEILQMPIIRDILSVFPDAELTAIKHESIEDKDETP